jgi:hypothetical protein
VLFAEVDKEFVDFLFTIFTLPVGAVVSLLKEGVGMAGSLPSLYKSIEILRANHIFQPDESKRFLLEPMVFMPGAKGPVLLPNVGSTLRQFYRCSHSSYSCDSYVADDDSSICPNCKSMMNQIVTFIEPPRKESPSKEGSLKGTYMVMDDLEVKVLSTIAVVTLVSSFNVEEIGGIEEKVVDLGIDEVHIYIYIYMTIIPLFSVHYGHDQMLLCLVSQKILDLWNRNSIL